MLPKNPNEYKTNSPAPECYLALSQNMDYVELFNRGFGIVAELKERWLKLISKVSRKITNNLIQLPIDYNGVFVEDIGHLVIINRLSLPVIWFKQVADSKFANSLVEIAKMDDKAFTEDVLEAILYQEFFELQILARDENIQALKNGVSKWEILQANDFNYMLGYKYFLMLLRGTRFDIDDTIEVDLSKVARYSEMVANGDVMPCELLVNKTRYGGDDFEILYSWRDVRDGNY